MALMNLVEQTTELQPASDKLSTPYWAGLSTTVSQTVSVVKVFDFFVRTQQFTFLRQTPQHNPIPFSYLSPGGRRVWRGLFENK